MQGGRPKVILQVLQIVSTAAAATWPTILVKDKSHGPTPVLDFSFDNTVFAVAGCAVESDLERDSHRETLKVIGLSGSLRALKVLRKEQ